MAAPHLDTSAHDHTPPASPYRAEEVAHRLGVATPTVYEHARRDPERWGVIRVGRAVRFKRVVIDRMAGLGCA